MNYSLSFQSKKQTRISVQQIKDYFKDRENYTLTDFQALYSNPATDVYFTFEYGGHHETAEASANILPLSFVTPCGKPHVFVLEAEPELAEFIRTFDLLVSDLLMQDPGYSEYKELDFYRGWSAQNEIFYRDFLKDKTQAGIYSLPVAWMEKIWRWNFHVPFMQAEQGKELFIPKILFIDYQSTLYSAVVWTDGQPIALPKVDKLILYRRALTGGFHLGKSEDMAISDVKDVEPLLKEYPLDQEALSYYTVIYKETPKEIKHFIQSQQAVKKDQVKFVGFAEIHDKEMIDKILKKDS